MVLQREQQRAKAEAVAPEEPVAEPAEAVAPEEPVAEPAEAVTPAEPDTLQYEETQLEAEPEPPLPTRLDFLARLEAATVTDELTPTEPDVDPYMHMTDRQKALKVPPPPTRLIATPARAPSTWDLHLSQDAQVDEHDDMADCDIMAGLHAFVTATVSSGSAVEIEVSAEAPTGEASAHPAPDQQVIRLTSQELAKYDRFAQRAELILESRKEQILEVDAGFYSEKAMKDDLKTRIKAVKAYCNATPQRSLELIRKDKYEPDILEYWTDIKTSGKLRRSCAETTIRKIEVTDIGGDFPGLMMDEGSAPRPLFWDNESASSKEPVPLALTNTPDPAAEKHSPAPKDVSQAPGILNQLLKAQNKALKVLDKVDDEANEGAGKVLSAGNGGAESPEVSDRLICDLASGFWEEHEALNCEVELPSSGLLRKMHRKRQTKHENSTQSLLKEFGLSCPIPIDYVDIGEQGHHEIFRVESYLRIFSLHDKMGLLLGHTKNLSVVKEFWHRHRQVYPNDPVFSCHAGREEFVIPCFLHADEGRTLKKSSILVCNLQPVLGGNPDPHYDPDELHTNMKFSSWATRLLMFVMLKKVYHKDSGPIDKVWASLSEELLHLFEHGVELFRLTPKYHAANHLVDYVLYPLKENPESEWVLNPVAWSTQQDEDFTGRVSLLSTAVSSRSCHVQTMARCAINLWSHVSDFEG
ncbi:unnamed protein product [Symbiodinium microadriaticum]|nr:unnamed protein product [Symbiodinium sp. KB8]CAE7880238.1 unnamed protein product [Symbiodinium microadriaticum]